MAEYNNPNFFCLNSGLARNFKFGSSSDTLGPGSAQCQKFLAQECSMNWSKICDELVINNLHNAPGVDVLNRASFNQSQSDALIRNAAIYKYHVAIKNCTLRYQLFNPNDPNSPAIYDWRTPGIWGSSRECTPELSLTKSQIQNIEKDALLLKILVSRPRFDDIVSQIKAGTIKSGLWTLVPKRFKMMME